MSLDQAKIRVEELSQQLHKYNKAYYTEDTSLITDQAFDLLLKELIDKLGMETELKEKRIVDKRPKT